MKEKSKFLGIILIIVVVGVFAACKDDDPEDTRPKVLGIPVNGTLTAEMRGFIEGAIGELTAAQQTYTKSNIKEIKIVSEESTGIEGTVLTVNTGSGKSAILTVLENWCESKGITMIYDQAKNIIYITAAMNAKLRESA